MMTGFFALKLDHGKGHGKNVRFVRMLVAVLALALIAVSVEPGFAQNTARKSSKAKIHSKPKVRFNFTAAKINDDNIPSPASSELSDPLESFNRVIFTINDSVDMVLLRPISLFYRTVFPKMMRKGVSNFMANMATPITLTNDLLQGEFARAETTFVRFMINTTGGIGGLNDLAAEAGYPRHYEDFGQTLAIYGVPSGPYLVLPIIGPATPRHALGRIVDTFTSPWTYILYNEPTEISAIPSAVNFLIVRTDNLDALDAIRKTSPDYYSSIKSIYWQNRKSEIANGLVEIDDLPEIPD